MDDASRSDDAVVGIANSISALVIMDSEVLDRGGVAAGSVMIEGTTKHRS